jgi:hypothetical protein
LQAYRFGTGRIGEIISFLEATHKKDVIHLAPEIKLESLCTAMQISSESLDSLMSGESPVFRTVKGHAFEAFFDTLIENNGAKSIEVGGDDAVDRIVNDISLQLKTPTVAGTKDNIVQYKTHKTHGAKSEKESFDYYHNLDHFADYLVGLISYSPLRIIFINKSDLPVHPLSKSHILSPFSVVWQDHPGLNNFASIGVNIEDLDDVTLDPDDEELPITSNILGLSSDVILNSILNVANFRVWDMCMRGFIRERVFFESLEEHNITRLPTNIEKKERSDKSDLAIKMNGVVKYLQMKGISTNNCDFDLKDPILGTETQLTRGRVNDHPTQSRLYLNTDFDYLILAIDPPVAELCTRPKNGKAELVWEYYLIPVDKLENHHKMSHRLKSLQKFKHSELQQYKVIDWEAQFAT